MTRPSQATVLVELAMRAGVDLFHDQAGVAYATLLVNEHHETHPVRSSAFGDWLRREHLRATDASPNGQALADARGTLGAVALFDGPTIPVGVRVGAGKRAVDFGGVMRAPPRRV